ncbi:MAG: hypothetical protein R2839_05720 [Thermomicrobiales bacterium]
MHWIRVPGLILALLMSILVGGAASAQGAATPESTTATPTDAAADATPVAQPIRVVTLVAWYQTHSSGDYIEVGPLASNDQLISGPGDATAAITGRADFDGPEDDGVPEITLGESVFQGVPAIAGDAGSMFRWTYPEGDGTLRPATLVIQVEAVAGPYDGFTGSATFISRSTAPGSGVIVIMLNPPDNA